MNAIEAAARALYDCERRRELHCAAIMSRAKGSPVAGMMEPYEESEEIWLHDATHALEAAINSMGWPDINAYHAELRRGQSIDEDAGGFMMRAIRRLFGLAQKPDPVVTYQQAARALLRVPE